MVSGSRCAFVRWRTPHGGGRELPGLSRPAAGTIRRILTRVKVPRTAITTEPERALQYDETGEPVTRT